MAGRLTHAIEGAVKGCIAWGHGQGRGRHVFSRAPSAYLPLPSAVAVCMQPGGRVGGWKTETGWGRGELCAHAYDPVYSRTDTHTGNVWPIGPHSHAPGSLLDSVPARTTQELSPTHTAKYYRRTHGREAVPQL